MKRAFVLAVLVAGIAASFGRAWYHSVPAPERSADSVAAHAVVSVDAAAPPTFDAGAIDRFQSPVVGRVPGAVASRHRGHAVGPRGIPVLPRRGDGPPHEPSYERAAFGVRERHEGHVTSAPRGRSVAHAFSSWGTGSSDVVDSPPSSASAPESAAPVTVELAATMDDGSRRSGSQFAGVRVNDLDVVVQWRSLQGPHRQRVAFYAPDGSLYQTRTAVVWPAPGTDDPVVVRTPLPVAGTWIRSYGLYGAWRVEIYLDNAPAPSLTQTFVLSRPS